MKMTSYQFAPSPRKRITGCFLARVRRELQKAFLEEKEARGVTQAKLARELGVDRAVVCRQLAGTSNLTLRTIADYAWALQRDLIFEMPKPSAALGVNHHMTVSPFVSEPARTPSTLPEGLPSTPQGLQHIATASASREIAQSLILATYRSDPSGDVSDASMKIFAELEIQQGKTTADNLAGLNGEVVGTPFDPLIPVYRPHSRPIMEASDG
jgi:transcriptional regulator with XRE-family HTH domain